MKNIKTIAMGLVTAIFLCCLLIGVPPTRGQLPNQIELTCQPGTTQVFQLLNASTGKYRQYQCVDNNGNLTNVVVSVFSTQNVASITLVNNNVTGAPQVTGIGWNVNSSGALTLPNQPISAQSVTITGGPFNQSAGVVGLGNTQGFGNGAAGTGVTTTALGTGSGPTTPQTIVNYLQIKSGSTTFWIPLVQ